MKKISEKILIAEDDHNLIECIHDLLKLIEPDFEIDCAENGTAAIKKASIKDYSIILSDYDMPEMNGIEFFLLLKEKKFKGKFYLMSGQNLDRKKIRKLKINGFLNKPFDLVSLKKFFIKTEKR